MNNSIPSPIFSALEAGADLAISVSGGKDSQAMLNYVCHLYQMHGWTGRLFAVFADLGEIEWQGTLEHTYKMCRNAGVQLVVVQRSRSGMIGRWQERWDSIVAKGESKPTGTDDSG